MVLRGGALPALILSDYLGVSELYAVRAKHWGIGGEIYTDPMIEWSLGGFRDKKLLVVDEVVDTGKTLKKVVEELKGKGAKQVKSAVLHVKPTTIYTPSFYVEKLREWVWLFYPWSLIETLFNLASREEKGKGVVQRALEIADGLRIWPRDPELLAKGIKNYISNIDGFRKQAEN